MLAVDENARNIDEAIRLLDAARTPDSQPRN